MDSFVKEVNRRYKIKEGTILNLRIVSIKPVRFNDWGWEIISFDGRDVERGTIYHCDCGDTVAKSVIQDFLHKGILKDYISVKVISQDKNHYTSLVVQVIN